MPGIWWNPFSTSRAIGFQLLSSSNFRVYAYLIWFPLCSPLQVLAPASIHQSSPLALQSPFSLPVPISLPPSSLLYTSLACPHPHTSLPWYSVMPILRGHMLLCHWPRPLHIPPPSFYLFCLLSILLGPHLLEYVSPMKNNKQQDNQIQIGRVRRQ